MSSDMSNTSCISYKGRMYEYLIPSPIIFSTMCLSYDRTELFIISIIRLILWIILTYVIGEMIDLTEYIFVKYLLFIMLGVNLLYVGIVVSTRPVFSLGTDETVLGYKERTGLNQNIPYQIN